MRRRHFQVECIASENLGIRRTRRIFRLVGKVTLCSFLLFVAATATAPARVLIFFLLLYFVDSHRKVIHDHGVKNIVVDRADLKVLAKKVINEGRHHRHEHKTECSDQQNIALPDVFFLDDGDVKTTLRSVFVVFGLQRIGHTIDINRSLLDKNGSRNSSFRYGWLGHGLRDRLFDLLNRFHFGSCGREFGREFLGCNRFIKFGRGRCGESFYFGYGSGQKCRWFRRYNGRWCFYSRC